MDEVVAVWSVKGGVGVTAVAAMLAMAHAARAEATSLIDLCGDAPAVLGLDAPDGPGVVDWCAMPNPSADALARIQIEASVDLSVAPRGSGVLNGDPAQLKAVLAGLRRRIIVDCGRLEPDGFCRDFVGQADQRILVTRPCFLNLRAASEETLVPTGVVLLTEPGRSYGRSDVEIAASAPVVACIAVDQSIARKIDSGLIRSRLPRTLVRAMGKVIADAV